MRQAACRPRAAATPCCCSPSSLHSALQGVPQERLRTHMAGLEGAGPGGPALLPPGPGLSITVSCEASDCRALLKVGRTGRVSPPASSSRPLQHAGGVEQRQRLAADGPVHASPPAARAMACAAGAAAPCLPKCITSGAPILPQVPIPEELRLARPPSIVIRCGGCNR